MFKKNPNINRELYFGAELFYWVKRTDTLFYNELNIANNYTSLRQIFESSIRCPECPLKTTKETNITEEKRVLPFFKNTTAHPLIT